MLKNILISCAEKILTSQQVIKLHIAMNGKWSEQEQSASIQKKPEGRTPIPGLLRILEADSDSSGFVERLVHHTENSVLDRPEYASTPRYMAGGRPRLATCTGVSWFRDRYLAVANFHGRHLCIYKLLGDLTERTDLRLEKIYHQDVINATPEDIAISADGTLAAVTHAPPAKCMTTLHRLDEETMRIMPSHQTLRKGSIPHGITFTPDSRFLIFTEILTGSVQVFDVSRKKGKLKHTFIAPIAPLTPKSVAMSPDGRFVAIVHANEIRKGEELLTGCRFSVHRFNSETGQIGDDPIAVNNDIGGFEACTFVKQIDCDSYELAVCNQGSDLVTFFHLNVEKSELKSIESHPGVSFPHGIDCNPTGTLIAVACYGDDNLRIFDIPSQTQRAAEADRPHALICIPAPTNNNSADGSSMLSSVDDLRWRGFHITFLVPHESALEQFSGLANRVIHLDLENSDSMTEAYQLNVTTIHSYLQQQNIVLIEATKQFGIEAIEAGRRANIPTALHEAQGTSENQYDTDSSPCQTKRVQADYVIRHKPQQEAASEAPDRVEAFSNAGSVPESITIQELHQRTVAGETSP